MHLSPETFEAVWIVLSLIVIEGLLSVDNALAIAALASHLPEKQKYLALKLGIVGAYVFRGLALLVANWIIHNQWLKLLGAAYLIYLMCAHLSGGGEEEDASAPRRKRPGLWMTILQIELMDLSLSIDNVVAAVVMSPRFWVVFTGVAIGILALRFLAGYCIRLIERFPILEKTAFLLVGYVGFLLLFEIGSGVEVHSTGKFAGIVLIILLTLWYGRSPALQRAAKPLVALLLPVMRFATGVVEFLFWPLTALYRKLSPAT